jgi:IS4 transposase
MTGQPCHLADIPAVYTASRPYQFVLIHSEHSSSSLQMVGKIPNHSTKRRTAQGGQFSVITTPFSWSILGYHNHKTLKCPIRVVWVFRKTQWVALFSTDLELSIEQIIEYYGARWKIESGFKELKQDIGSSKSQARNAHAVINHINFSMMAATVTWIYGARLANIPERRHKVKGRNSFAFSDLRHIIAKAALSEDFDAVCDKHDKLPQKSFVDALLRMVA